MQREKNRKGGWKKSNNKLIQNQMKLDTLRIEVILFNINEKKRERYQYQKVAQKFEIRNG
ncbi:unnamed protein product [Paramecium sonneborni]|uniref:Uncharacterized protein n=1 Tax=Paramecium sonneborni TaxID=65129 RepID=A0A8S1R0A4_9CILI|nr:unnamed protein product [Paramecium sonneborni]